MSEDEESCASLASILLIAPSAQHRLLWRQYDKKQLLERANRLAIAGLALLALAIVGATFLVTDLVFETAAAAGVAAGIAGGATWFWYIVPLWRRLTR